MVAMYTDHAKTMHEPVRTHSNIGRIATVLPGLYHLTIENEAVRCVEQALIHTKLLSHTSQPAAQTLTQAV